MTSTSSGAAVRGGLVAGMPNSSVNPSPRSVMPRACARVAPSRAAGYAGRWTDRKRDSEQMRRWQRVTLVGAVVASCIGCDQVSKGAAQEHLVGHEPLWFLGGMVRLTYVENPGGFLSLGAELPPQVRFWVFGVATALMLALLSAIVVSDQSNPPVFLLGIAMILGGGIGNLLDRLGSGVVRDFVNVGIGPIRTGVFNVADLAIMAGAAIVACLWGGRQRGPTRPTTR